MVTEAEAGLEIPIGLTEQKFVKQLARIEARALKAANSSEQAFVRSNAKTVTGFNSAEQSAGAFSAELDRLRNKYDPLYAAQQKYNAQLAELNRIKPELSVGAYEKALGSLNADLARASTSAGGAVVATANKVTASNVKMAKSFSGISPSARGQIQNVSYQLQDLFVQISAGTAATTALGQQMPQLLGGFGALGAVLGVVAAVALPLAGTFLSAGEKAQTLDEKVKSLEGAVKDYRSAVENATMPTADLAEKYGKATDAARDFFEALEQINKANAQDSLDTTLDAISEKFGKLQSENLQPNAQLLDLVNGLNLGGFDTRTLDDLAEKLKITQGAALQVAGGLEKLQTAKGPEAQAQAARELADTLQSTLGPAADMSDEARELYEQLSKAGVAASDLTGAAGQASGALDGAASSAGRIADELQRAVNNAIQLSAQGINDLQRSQIELQYKDNPTGRAAALAGLQFDSQTDLPAGPDPTVVNVVNEQRKAFIENAVATEQNRQALIAWQKEQAAAEAAAKKAANGSKSKKAKPGLFAASDEDLLRIERQMDLLGKSGAQVAELQARWALLDEAKRRGLAVDDELNAKINAQAEAIGNLTEKHKQLSDQQAFVDNLTDDLKDGFLDAIVSGESLSGVFEDLAKSIAKAALQAALFNEGVFASGSGGGLLGGLFSSATSLLSGKRATGGGVGAGSAYLVNENTPNSEIFVPSQNGAILNVPQAQAALRKSAGSGAATVVRNISIDARGAQAGVADQIVSALAAYDEQLPARVVGITREDWRR
ncbi:hypothetical protein RPE78_09140 [Thioclava litoralis]|uniref:Prophage tail length tape measure protein n=1 Tax=Thioclava litoralis TaxID=3076557 RepID=A0ABZ1DVT3_9RHOB|nr:hypothetical protein RPE78_09140 [Thioclava sp. FTW29]